MKDGKGEGRMPVFRRRLQSRDFDAIAEAFRGWDADFRQIGRGPFRGELDVAEAGGVQVLRVAVDRVIQARGRGRGESYNFPLIIPKSEAASWHGRSLLAGQLRVMGPGEAMDHLSSDDYEALDVSVNVDLLRRKSEALYGVDPEDRLAGRFAVNVDRRAFAALETTLRRVLGGNGAAASGLCAVEEVAEMEDACVRRLLRALASADPLFEGAVRNVNRPALLRRAEDFMAAHLRDRVKAEELCAELGVSERTLRYAFQDRYGLSPMTYFKTQKLNAVRRRLKAGGAADHSVNAIAARWGFNHTGNFAADYRRLFGELPSRTLRGRKSK